MRNLECLGPEATNGASETIDTSKPYRVEVEITGDADILFHRYNNESVEAKGKAAKGSKAKKSDDVESYVYRDGDGFICLPGEYLRQSLVHAAKYRQDPRSPRKSMMDLAKAAIVSLTGLASLGTKTWDVLDRRRVIIQRSAVTRERPMLLRGWKATIHLMVLLPEYVGLDTLRGLIADAGRLVGVGDFRPTYGRFSCTRFEVLE